MNGLFLPAGEDFSSLSNGGIDVANELSSPEAGSLEIVSVVGSRKPQNMIFIISLINR